jgi:hypothetical protein
MAAYIFLPKQAAAPHREALQAAAGRQAAWLGLSEQEWWWVCRDDEIVFAFGGEKGRTAAILFSMFACGQFGIPPRLEW